MTKYTVIGIYESTGQVFADWVEAQDAWAAMKLCANSTLTPGDLQILGAVQGRHDVLTACDDSGKAAFASDLR